MFLPHRFRALPRGQGFRQATLHLAQIDSNCFATSGHGYRASWSASRTSFRFGAGFVSLVLLSPQVAMDSQAAPAPGSLSWRLSSHPITLLTFLSFRVCKSWLFPGT